MIMIMTMGEIMIVIVFKCQVFYKFKKMRKC